MEETGSVKKKEPVPLRLGRAMGNGENRANKDPAPNKKDSVKLQSTANKQAKRISEIKSAGQNTTGGQKRADTKKAQIDPSASGAGKQEKGAKGENAGKKGAKEDGRDKDKKTQKEVQILRPNLSKIFLANLIKVSLAMLGIIFGFFMFKISGGFSVVDEALYSTVDGIYFALGTNENAAAGFSSSDLVSAGLIIIIVAYVLILIINYFLLSNLRYEFTKDKVTVYLTSYFVLLKRQEIPFRNVTRIFVDDSKILDKLLKTGSVMLVLSAMNIKEYKIEGIDNPKAVADYIHTLKRYYDYRAFRQQKNFSNMDEYIARGFYSAGPR